MTGGVSALDGRVVVVGAGIAGLATALRLAPRPVVVISKGALGAEGSTNWAQGGLAAAVGDDDDAEQHAADTLAAGGGLCDEAVVRRFASATPAAIEQLAAWGARFDRGADGRLALGQEAAHRRRRIVHAGGDGSGREIMRALTAAVRRTPSITVLDGAEARRLVVEGGRIRGVVMASADKSLAIATNAIVLATGGVGGLYDVSTNPLGSFGQGLALAARAGAALVDLEFVQFHPTALQAATRPAPLITEAVRGEGAILIDDAGERFMADIPGRELAARDVVARAIWRRRRAGRQVFLDARAIGARFASRFPSVSAICAQHGIDPTRDPIPVRPAAHYHMGGIAVDQAGRSSIDGLWACGEVACTGLHGANRLASNSLTEAVVFARWVADDISGATESRAARLRSNFYHVAADPAGARRALSAAAGVERDAEGLRAGIKALLPLADSDESGADPAAVAMMICVAALRRDESRGAHARADFPMKARTPARRSLTLAEALRSARELASNLKVRTA
ncbi:MAG: L-aspartate oxidase [Roseiarcus sp.]|jgi:L-aspartate oxidase